MRQGVWFASMAGPTQHNLTTELAPLTQLVTEFFVSMFTMFVAAREVWRYLQTRLVRG